MKKNPNNSILKPLAKTHSDGMAKLILIIPAISTLWRDATNDSKPPHVKTGCDIGDRVT